MKRVFRVFIVFTILLTFNSCYTKLEKDTNSDDRLRLKDSKFSEIDYNLVGSWFRIIRMIDGPDSYEKIEFYKNGAIKFYPNATFINSKIYFGRWGINSELLRIKFDQIPNDETMIYKIEGESLIVKGVNPIEGRKVLVNPERLISKVGIEKHWNWEGTN